jgi:DNA-binding MarR family transcriptional regulator
MPQGSVNSGGGQGSKNNAAAEHQLGRRILHALRRVIRAVDIYSRKLVVQHHITGPQLVCLHTLIESGPVTATDLAYRVQLSASTVVRILDRLESKGLIKRQRLSHDRRRVQVEVTVSGYELCIKTPYSDQHPLRRALLKLSPQEQETVTTLLERLVDLMDAQDLSAGPVIEVSGIQVSREQTWLPDSGQEPGQGN